MADLQLAECGTVVSKITSFGERHAELRPCNRSEFAIGSIFYSMPIMGQRLTSRQAWNVIFVGAGILFWLLRVSYWFHTSEEPFSDMADFETIAFRIMDSGSFAHSDFWQSYKPPVLPILGAFVYTFFGKHNLLAWQFFQASVLFLMLWWVCFEVTRLSRNRLIGLLLFLTVALTKPSIFWSLKFATESLAEAFLYGCAAAWLRAFRLQSNAAYAIAGILSGITLLHRPNFIGFVPFAVLLVLWYEWRGGNWKTLLKRAAFISFCVILVWAPWMIRTYRLYGVPMIGNTSGGFTLIFDLGQIDYVHPDGTIEKFTNNDLIGQAPTRFKNDYEAHVFAQNVFKQWVSRNSGQFFSIVRRRIIDMATVDSVALTRVSRTDLFSEPVNSLLLDKNGYVVLAGIVGLLLLPMLSKSVAGVVLFSLAIPPWLVATLFQDTSRMFDPMLGMVLFGALYFLYALFSLVHARALAVFNTQVKAT